MPTHFVIATRFTREGNINLHNRKPYRTKALKARAKAVARRQGDGAFRCSVVPTLIHPVPKEGAADASRS